ncbi:MAG: hypothetical protein J6M60_00015 [Clostridia bacterium]|nr:hypothetical protein [Clostridia bacterium]
MKKRIILICAILLAIIGIIVGVIICINQDKTDYNRLYLNSLEFDGRLAEYTFNPKINDDGVYKIKFKVKDDLKDNIRISLYKLEDGKELNIKLDDKLESEELEKVNELDLKLVVYVEKSYNMLDKDYIDIGYLSINNAN